MNSDFVDTGARRTVAEAITLYELEPSIRDVFVEGNSDKSFFEWFLATTREGERVERLAQVYSIDDRIFLPDELIVELGLLPGARGRVISAAVLFSELSPDQKCATFIADSDFSSFSIDASPSVSGLLYTDFASLENYAFNEETLDKLFGLVLGASGILRGAEVMASTTRALMDVFAVRAALREAPGGSTLMLKFADHLSWDGKMLVLDVPEVLQRSYFNAPSRDRRGETPDGLLARVRQFQKLELTDIRCAIRGHDICHILVRYIKIKHPRIFREDRRAFERPEVLERSMMGCLEAAFLTNHMLFRALLARLN